MRADEVDRALDEPRRAGDPERRQAEQRQPSTEWIVDVRGHDLEEPRHDVDLDVELAQRADRARASPRAALGERDDDALDVEQRARARAARRAPPSNADVRKVGAELARLASTKPTRWMPYSGCWRILRAISWPTSPAPTMIVFWT